MYYNDPITQPLSDFINTKINWAEAHGTENETRTLYELIDLIGNLMDNQTDRDDWYNLCNTIAPENMDENTIS